jgi:hypothetical protein
MLLNRVSHGTAKPLRVNDTVGPFPDLIDHYCALFAAVALEIALAITVQIEPPRKDAPGDRAFPDRGTDSFALPHDFTWKAHIDGQKFRHLLLQPKWFLVAKS